MLNAVPTPDNTIGIPWGDSLLATKLYPRQTRANLVARPRVTRLLDEGLSASLILVSAPAGFGKTTLLAEWLRNQPAGCCWLSLDSADNNPERFWAYVILALQAIHDEVGETALAQLRSPQPPPVQLILPILLNDIELLHKRTILVLDDYHIITSTLVNSALTYFLENLPPNLHLIISTRSDPPIPLAKLRSRGQVVEIRTDELRFTPDETAAFLRQTMGLTLSSEQVASLDERAEGWIAGLQMAALSMQGRDAERVDDLIQAFAGTNRFIMDFMLEEVLAGEPEGVQAFLLRTAILRRLSGPLCDAVTAASGSQEMLERLERRNLFVVPLDDERIWYRYHHLFGDLLQRQLQKTLGAQGVALLHLRAAEWYEQNNSILEAIHHASLASKDEMVERLIKQNYLEMMNRGEMSWVRSWMGNLNKELVYRRPWLCLYEAMNRSWFGQLEEANALLQEAEKRIQAEGAGSGTRSMLGYHAYVKSRVTAMQGDTRQAIEFCLTARENVPADSLELQIDFSITLGYEYFLYGDFTNANKILNETIRLGHIAKAINNPVAAYCLLARSQIYQGRLHEAEALLQKAERLIHPAGGQYLGAVGLVEVESASLLYEWNDIDTALVRLKRGLENLPWWGKADDFCLAYMTLARIQLARGNRTDAVGAMEKAAQLVQTCGVFSEARSAVETAQVKWWLAQGDWSSVDRWMATLDKRFGSPDPFRFEDEVAHITQARVFIAQNKLNEAIRLLSRLGECARSGGREGRLIEITILKALAMQRMGDTAQADLALAKTLDLAEPEGYVRVFLDEAGVEKLLSRYLRAPSAKHRSYALRLLKALSVTSSPVAQGDLIEPLTSRELEVLQLICAGDSNQAIADKLVITVSGVKKHTGNILGKLGVTRRAQAIVKARQLGLFEGDP